jgi:hypothetical protein
MARGTEGRLTPFQAEFVRQYTAGVEGVRGNQSAAYKAAGGKATSPAVMAVVASQTLNNPKVFAAIQALHAQADAVILAQLISWKVAGVQAQKRLIALGNGVLPDDRAMVNRDDVAVGQVVLGAVKELLERAWPKKLRITVDPQRALAQLLGIEQGELPMHEGGRSVH